MTQKTYFIITAFLVSCNLVNAQFVGGSTKSSLNGSKLNGEIASFSVLYQGSLGDGHDAETTQLLLASNHFDIYHGSSGDGFSLNSASVTITGDDINSLFYGDSGDGHSFNRLQGLLSGVDLSVLYRGNIGDGTDFDLLNSTILQGFILATFDGGNGDGFSNLLQPNNYLSGLMLTLFNGGNGDGFAFDTLKTALTLDLVEQLIKMEVLLFPNPANHIVTIKPNNGIQITAIELYDISGKKVNLQLSNDNTINVSGLSDGIYLLNIISENGSVTKKLVVKK